MSDLMLMYEYLTDEMYRTLDAELEADVAYHFEVVTLRNYYKKAIEAMA